MLRLWPEQITVGLFPGRCWLRRRGRAGELFAPEQADISSLTAAFDALLAEAVPLRGARLDLIVSDQVGRVVALPWQQSLRSRSEWQTYALAAFDANGVPLDDGWVCVPATRRHGEHGLAVALPAAWIAVLEERARRHGARLRTVMPLSAAAYWSPRRWMAARGPAWMVLEDGAHATLLCFEGRRCTTYDTQPALDERGLCQLLQRRVLTGVPTRIAVWRADGAPSAAMLEAIIPEASMLELPHDYWNRHA